MAWRRALTFAALITLAFGPALAAPAAASDAWIHGHALLLRPPTLFDGGALRVTVYWADTTPAVGATVQVETRHTTLGVGHTHTATTDANGVATIELARDVSLANAPGHHTAAVRATIATPPPAPGTATWTHTIAYQV